MQRMSIKKLGNAGFTIVELSVTIIVTSIMTIIIFGIMYNFIRDNTVSDGRANMVYETQTTLNKIEADVALSSQFLTGIDGSFSDPLGPNDAGGIWNSNGTSTTSRYLIIRGFASTKDVTDETKAPVFINQYGCDPTIINSNPLLRTNVIYFVKNGTLYRRILTDTSQNTCDPQFQKQTCTANLVSGYPICQSADQQVLEDVEEFRLDYYVNVLSSPVQIPGSNSSLVRVTIKLNREIYGERFDFTSSILIKKINTEN